MTDQYAKSEDPSLASEATSSSAKARGPLHARHWKQEFWLLCSMLILSLVGLGITQAAAAGAWEFWIIAVLAFCGIGVFHTSQRAKRAAQPIRPMVFKQLLHWGGLLVALKVMILLERTDTISRESASDCSLILLALTCFLAGVHFDGMFLILGVVLAIMVVALGTAQQYAFLLWVIMIPVAAAGAGVFYLKVRKGHT